MINILIVIKSPIERERCSNLIKSCVPDVIIWSTGCGEKALQLLRNTEIDIIFIDVDLSDIDGFMLVAAINKDREHSVTPLILIADMDTSKPKEYHNIKYHSFITKPYSDNFIIEKTRVLSEGIRNKKESILTEARATDQNRKIYIPSSKSGYYIMVSDILFAEVTDHDVMLHTKKQVIRDIRMTLGQLIEHIGNKNFIRCHKSYAINIENIDSYYTTGRNTRAVYFDKEGKNQCSLSNFYYKKIMEQIENSLA